MHSIKTKIIAETIGAIIITMVIALFFGVTAIKNLGMSSSEQMLLLLCDSGRKNLDFYLGSVEQEVKTVSAYVESDLKGLDDEHLKEHVGRVKKFFKKTLYRTNGVMTFYYRIDPEVSQNVKGFWYINTDGEGFKESKVTDITQYDTEDTSKLVWFTVPKTTGKPTWLTPYFTDNLGVRVISYNIPVFFEGRFVGVIGIELDTTFIAAQVRNITLYEHGRAFISDSNGYIVYHPLMNNLTREKQERIPDGFLSGDKIINYEYEGEKMIAVCLPLINGDSLNVSVPFREIEASWHKWINIIVSVFVLLLVIFIVFIMNYTSRITKPLQDLTNAAEQLDRGDYDFSLDYKGNDEIGLLTRTFNRTSANLKRYITDLNDMAYADALTSLRNKGAFDIYMSNIQSKIESGEIQEFAVCIFDCNNLKTINDKFGHDKGDIYLKKSAELICRVFEHCPVFRIGGDEFAAILQKNEFKKRMELVSLFDAKCREIRDSDTEAWEKTNVARGLADYDPGEDESVNDVIRHADKNMYENKWQSKRGEL
ncbi:sensor domain-containing diguanylate cyclase [Oribacterium sp. WCC10]|uniref:sensor domain-containing diguanylate cyclase n=1 Tax=Oribacterium sp. WCC10 TaxID=1855343 RepID=UPI0008E725CC|nr:diguanylate cyclase [Oribacterium sp. WCC10]SFG67762.1 diguanylate cyclase (GGDEF) domain-containing protein [Oribacterium sp. WCC10]